jgi:hypothetical protein
VGSSPTRPTSIERENMYLYATPEIIEECKAAYANWLLVEWQRLKAKGVVVEIDSEMAWEFAEDDFSAAAQDILESCIPLILSKYGSCKCQTKK